MNKFLPFQFASDHATAWVNRTSVKYARKRSGNLAAIKSTYPPPTLANGTFHARSVVNRSRISKSCCCTVFLVQYIYQLNETSVPFHRQALKLHESVHSTDRPYSCAMCPKQFKSLSARRTHELTHVGVVFPCSLCDKSYQYKSLLNAHVKKHHSEAS